MQRLERERFLVSAAEPCLRWFEDCGLCMDALVRDVSTDLGVLALQGWMPLGAFRKQKPAMGGGAEHLATIALSYELSSLQGRRRSLPRWQPASSATWRHDCLPSRRV